MIDMIIMLAYTFFIPRSLLEPGLDHTCATYNLSRIAFTMQFVLVALFCETPVIYLNASLSSHHSSANIPYYMKCPL